MKHAATFFEAVIVIVIVGILATGFSWFFVNVIDMWNFNSYRSEIVGQMRFGLMRLSRDVRRAGIIETAAVDEFTFTMLDDNDYTIRKRYIVQNDTLLLELDNLPQDNPDGTYETSNVLLSGLSALTFTYYDEHGNTTTSATDVYSIAISVTLTRGDEAISVTSTVFPRNFM